MASAPENVSMALFCDFENIALGVRDAQYEKFDIKPVLERLLVKGSIVVKKAYCDWDRYKAFKATMHEANFELIEIPHVRQSGKNSADIRLVVDALDLCYTKAHVDTFVIISGDSDFSPLVSKLRENAKHVIGVGVKQSTSDLLIANCDEFIFYDDLVRDRETKRNAARKDTARETNGKRGEEDKNRKEDLEARRSKGIDLAVATFEDLMAERSDTEKLWASVLKEAIKRRNPGFNESYFGFKAFGNLLEEAQNRGLISFGRDEKSGAYVFRSSSAPTPEFSTSQAPSSEATLQEQENPLPTAETDKPKQSRGRNRSENSRASGKPANKGGRRKATSPEPEAPVLAAAEPSPTAAQETQPAIATHMTTDAAAAPATAAEKPKPPRKSPRKPAAPRSRSKKTAPTEENT